MKAPSYTPSRSFLPGGRGPTANSSSRHPVPTGVLGHEARPSPPASVPAATEPHAALHVSGSETPARDSSGGSGGPRERAAIDLVGSRAPPGHPLPTSTCSTSRSSRYLTPRPRATPPLFSCFISPLPSSLLLLLVTATPLLLRARVEARAAAPHAAASQLASSHGARPRLARYNSSALSDFFGSL